jgi:hypothetical protein
LQEIPRGDRRKVLRERESNPHIFLRCRPVREETGKHTFGGGDRDYIFRCGMEKLHKPNAGMEEQILEEQVRQELPDAILKMARM